MKNVNEGIVKLLTNPKLFHTVVHVQMETPFSFEYLIWLFSKLKLSAFTTLSPTNVILF